MHRRRFLVGVAGGVALAGCSGPQSLDAGSERWSIDPGAYEYLTLEVQTPATIEYAVEVLSGPAVDVLVLQESRFPEFEADELSATTPKSMRRNVENADANGNLMPGTWYLIVDNSGLTGVEADPATVAVTYELTKYIPYGSGRHATDSDG